MRLILVLLITAVLGYTPQEAKCPSNNLIRSGDDISEDEKNWVDNRRKKTTAALSEYVKSVGLDDAVELVENSSINIGIALSGGGYRSMLVGVGQLAALDNRTEVTEGSSLGGIMQSANYISGLSGGSYLIGSLSLNNWPSVHQSVLENDLWNLTEANQLVNTDNLWTVIWPVITKNLWEALSHINHWVTGKNTGIKYDLQAKKDAGFPVTLTDAWGRDLSYQLFSEENNAEDLNFSDIRDQPAFKNYEMPFPFITAIGREPGTIVYNTNSTVFEMNPFEMGSSDPSLNTFTDIKYLGSRLSNGTNNGTCVTGFENAGFMVGTSSSLFNEYLNTLVCDDCSSLNFAVKWVLKRFLIYLSNTGQDVAQYPNTFKNNPYGTSRKLATNDTLYLLDGGLAGEVIPITPMMTTKRKLDAVFALDNSENWPDGSSLITSYERQFTEQGKNMVIPYVPDQKTFLHQNLTAKPTFFGCSAKNLTDLVKDDVVPPLVIYLPNRPYTFWTNISLYQFSFTNEEKKAIIQNGFETVLRLNGTIDEDWPTCVGCAVIRREEERQGIEQSEQCKKCFEDYCWDGTIYESDEPYYPPLNFTDSGLTNDSVTYENFSNVTASSSSLFLFF